MITTTTSAFVYHRVTGGQVPPREDTMVDVAVLDMNHQWPNLGHDSVVKAIQEIVDRLKPRLGEEGLRVRVISYDVRHAQDIPSPDDDRFLLYVGTGGPGEYDPRRNDGVRETSQGIEEDAAWEPRIHALFDAILADERRALIAICHSFGLLCLWSGIAEARIRSAEKGGKSSGVVWNEISEEGKAHPWFARFASEMRDRSHFAVLDNRLFDLVPTAAMAQRATPLAWEVIGQERGEALTMMELARSEGAEFPRVFGMNFHPEIVDRQHVMKVMSERLARREVTEEWYRERLRIFRDDLGAPGVEPLIRLTSRFTLLAPVEYHLRRILAAREGKLGRAPAADSQLPTL